LVETCRGFGVGTGRETGDDEEIPALVA
jgi:hypothetical protein